MVIETETLDVNFQKEHDREVRLLQGHSIVDLRKRQRENGID
jgi:hypothetical protein